MSDAAWPFVGRETDLDECLRQVDAHRSVLLAGPAGIGKTRLAREIADRYDDTRPVVRLVATFAASMPVLNLVGSDETPLVVLDDIHLLDDDAAAILGSMVVDRDIVLVATMRTGTSMPNAVTALWKDEHVKRLDLPPLTRPLLDEILDQVMPGPIDSSTRRQLWDLTMGSPLFLRELLRSSIGNGWIAQRDGMWRLVGRPRSERLDELVGARLDELDDEVREVIELVAVGEPVPFAPLLSNVGAARLDAAERSGLIEVVIDELRRDVRLAHPVFGDVTVHRIGASRAAMLSARLLEMIESTPMRRRDDIVRAATWQLRAGGQLVTDDMVLAARRALYDRNEWLAIELASQAAGDRRPDAVLVVSQAFSAIGQPERAAQLLSELGGELDDVDRALVAIQRAVVTFWGLGDAAAAELVLEQAEQSLPAGTWRDEVRAERAVIAATQGQFSRALEIADGLITPTISPRVFVTAAIAGAVSMALGGRSVDAAELADLAFTTGAQLTLAPGMSDPMIHVVARALALSESGDLAASEEVARFGHAVSVQDGLRHGQAWFALVLGRTLLMRGRMSEARPLFQESAAAFAFLHSAGPRRWALAGIVQASAAIGDVAVAEHGWLELISTDDHPAKMMGVEVHRAEAWLSVARGDLDTAFKLLTQLADAAFEAGSISLGGAVLHDIMRIGRVPPLDQPDQLDQLGRLDAAQGVLAPLRAAYVRAVAAHDAVAVESAADRFGQIGAHLYAAEAYQRSAVLHAARGGVRAVTRCQTSALAMQRKTGETSLPTLALADSTARGDGPVEMTDREREVAALAAAGRSNREIADSLYLSVRTVENHLQHVYDKLGLRGRHELGTNFAGS